MIYIFFQYIFIATFTFPADVEISGVIVGRLYGVDEWTAGLRQVIGKRAWRKDWKGQNTQHVGYMLGGQG